VTLRLGEEEGKGTSVKTPTLLLRKKIVQKGREEGDEFRSFLTLSRGVDISDAVGTKRKTQGRALGGRDTFKLAEGEYRGCHI